MEAYNSVSIRDWWVGFERDEIQQLWKVNMKIHCETPDSGIDHTGTFTVTISDLEQVVQTFQQETVLNGDDNRQVSTSVLTFDVPYSQVTKLFDDIMTSLFIQKSCLLHLVLNI